MDYESYLLCFKPNNNFQWVIMKRWIVCIFAFLGVPVLLVTLCIVRKTPTFEGKDIEAWMREIKIGEPSPALGVFQRMGDVGVERLQQVLNSDASNDKVKAAWALGQLGSVASNAIPDLVRSLDDPKSVVAIFSMQALEHI